MNPTLEPLAVKRRIGYLPDAVGFYDNLSAADNLRYTARLNGFTPAEREERIKSSLADAGLAHVANKSVATFSHGMRQRLGVAEILMKGAEVALLDEPTSGLDPQSQIEFLAIIRNLKRKNVSMLLSSHLLTQVQSVCDRVALFYKGSIVLIGTVPELAQQVLGGGVHVEVEAIGHKLAETLKRVPGVNGVEVVSTNHFRLLADHDVRPDAAAAVVADGGRLLRLEVAVPSLEAIYTSYFHNMAAQKAELHAA
jgi:ABC-2 type transport system ATP-binding protein